MFQPGALWHDTDGHPIQAHGGGMLFHAGTYYWYGENRDIDNQEMNGSSYRTPIVGVQCYSSKNLLDWTNEGTVLPAVPDDPDHDLFPFGVAERPKVIYNETTGKFVMWLHIDKPGHYLAKTGVAFSDTPTGPFTYQESFQPNGLASRDISVFKDTDGKAYLLHGAGWHNVFIIAELTDDYLRPTGHYSEHFHCDGPPDGREAPAMFKHGESYFLVTSGTTSWEPNPLQVAVADHIHGPWNVLGNPCIGADADIAFHSQSTCVFPVDGHPGAFIYMGDRWNKEHLRDSRYIWLPLQWREDTTPFLEWHNTWSLVFFTT